MGFSSLGAFFVGGLSSSLLLSSGPNATKPPIVAAVSPSHATLCIPFGGNPMPDQAFSPALPHSPALLDGAAGSARFSTDPELLATMAVMGKLPKCAIIVSVRQAYLHCAKALLRSKLWTGEYVQPKGTFPSIARMVGDQVGMTEEQKKKGE